MHRAASPFAAAGVGLLMLAGCRNAQTPASQAAEVGALRLTHGVAVGDVSSHQAVIWSRASRTSEMVVSYGTAESMPHGDTVRAAASEAGDFTAQVTLSGLVPDTRYFFEVYFESSAEMSQRASGAFQTAPSASDARSIRFVFAGDLGGHDYCREQGKGYDFFDHMAALNLHFLIANGDMIYADSECPEKRPEGGDNIPGDFPRIDAPEIDWNDAETVREIYFAHWRYNRADPHFQKFLSGVPMVAQWDDHEVINDFGAPWPERPADAGRTGFRTLVEAGLVSFFAYNPIARDPDEPRRIYRSFRWGQDVELFVLDARSYRSANQLSDLPGNSKTILGSAQLAWLKNGLASSDATWKIITTDVPLSIPTGSEPDRLGRDAFANGISDDFSSQTGFERELTDLLTYLDEERVRNLMFVATDVHFAMNLRYQVDMNDDGEPLTFYELISGPLSAFRLSPVAPDPTFQPEVLYSEGELFNYGFVRVERQEDGSVHLLAEVRDTTGAVRPGSTLDIAARR